MPVTDLPWLRQDDVVGDYLRGVQVGGQIASERNRLAQQEQEAQLDAQVRGQVLQRQQQEQQERLAVSKARLDAESGLRKQQLDQIEQMNAFKTKQAAIKMQDQYGFAQDLAGGMPIEQALFRHPTLATPSAMVQAHKDELDLGTQRLDLARQRLEQQRELAQQRLDMEKEKAKTGGTSGHVATKFGDLTFGSVPISSPAGQAIIRNRGTNMPMDLMTNLVPGYVPPSTNAASSGPGFWSRLFGSSAPKNATVKEVRRKTKDGRMAVFDANTKQFIRYADEPDNAE